MTLEQVIEMGKNIQRPEYDLFSQFTTATWWWVVGLFVVGLIVIVFSLITDSEGGFGGFLCIVAIAICFIKFLSVEFAESGEYTRLIDEWKETVAIPYINNLPLDKKEVVFIKIDPELSSNVQGNTLLGTGYTYTTPIEKTPISFSYKDNGVITKTLWVETHMNLTNEERPYVEFQRLDKDLGHGIKAGNYNYKIYLPESYQFTDIK